MFVFVICLPCYFSPFLSACKGRRFWWSSVLLLEGVVANLFLPGMDAFLVVSFVMLSDAYHWARDTVHDHVSAVQQMKHPFCKSNDGWKPPEPGSVN